MDTYEAVQALAALAHEKRLKMFRVLVRCGPRGMPAGDIARVIGISPTAMSFHLKELDRAGILTSWRTGRYIHYAVRVEGIRQLLTFLTEDCCAGRPELCGDSLRNVQSLCSEETSMKNDEPYNVLFLCTHNSARSVIGECLMNSMGQGAFKAYSAGSAPRGEINPFAIRILKNFGHKTDKLRSKSWDEFTAANAPEIDFVFTLCDEAAAETCPVWPGNPITEHWGMPDPSRAEGTDSNKLAAFANTYSLLNHHIKKFTELAKRDLDEKSMRREVEDFSIDVRRRNLEGLGEDVS